MPLFSSIMNMSRWIYVWAALLILSSGTVSALPPRQDINPALLYWQAFSLFPELDETESKLLSSETSGDVSADERVLAKRFDAPMAFIIRARLTNTPCDWGMDVADGPNAIVPNAKKIRAATSAALLRARVALADGQETRARDELLAVSVMGRHAATGASLVGAMIQVGVDTRLLDFISAHFDGLKPQTRTEIAAGLQGAPTRTTVAEAMANEKTAFYGWFLDKLEGCRAGGNDDAKILQQFRTLTMEVFVGEEKDLADRIVREAGGTGAGVIKYVKEIEPHYAHSFAVARASAQDVKQRATEFEAAIDSTTNLIARMVLPNVGKARMKELEFQARLSKLPNAAP